MRTRRRTATVVGLALVLGLSACSNKKDVVTEGKTEGIYVDVGPLKYQVQDSRLLNPAAIPEDATFVTGVPAPQAALGKGEGWFAVFVRVENESSDPQRLARDLEIIDADRELYKPAPIGAANPFRYVSETVPAKATVPQADSVAGQTSINGRLLLFKVKLRALDESRPLRLVIHSATDPKLEAEIDLDV